MAGLVKCTICKTSVKTLKMPTDAQKLDGGKPTHHAFYWEVFEREVGLNVCMECWASMGECMNPYLIDPERFGDGREDAEDAGSCASNETEGFVDEPAEPVEHAIRPEDLQHLHEIYVKQQIDAGLLKRVKPVKVKKTGKKAGQKRKRVARDYSIFKVGVKIWHTYKGQTDYAVYQGEDKFSFDGDIMNISGFPKSHVEKLIKKGLCPPTKSGKVSFNGWDVCSFDGGMKGVWD